MVLNEEKTVSFGQKYGTGSHELHYIFPSCSTRKKALLNLSTTVILGGEGCACVCVGGGGGGLCLICLHMWYWGRPVPFVYNCGGGRQTFIYNVHKYLVILETNDQRFCYLTF